MAAETVARVPDWPLDERARSRRLGGWRTVAALPAVVGSTLLMLVLLGWAGRWEPLFMLAGLGSGAAMFTRVGERGPCVSAAGSDR